jgi:hypothetical protein
LALFIDINLNASAEDLEKLVRANEKQAPPANGIINRINYLYCKLRDFLII